MKSLIDPRETPISYIQSWTDTQPYQAIWGNYPNSCRIAQVVPDDQVFEVGEPLFWTNCADNVVADEWYYDTVTQQIIKIVNAPKPPAEDQPVVTGAQTI